MLKKAKYISLVLLFSIPAVAMENPAAGHKGLQQIVTAVRIGNLAELQNLQHANPGINLDQITDRGFPLVLITAMQNKVDMMHYLLRVLLLNPNANFNGQNALHLAASRGHIDMVKYLVEMARFDINAKDNGAKTALDLAKQHNKADVTAYLSSKAAKRIARPLPVPPAKPAAKPAPKQVEQPKPVTKSCIVCAEDRQPDQFISLGCGHEFCRECLGFMLNTSLKDKSTQAFKCPIPKCNHLLENDLHKITHDHAKIAELSEIQLKEYLTKEQNTKNCPTTNCGFSFINERADQFTMQCPDCKKEYCGKCLHKHESTTSCQQAEQNRAIANDTNAQERANAQWLAENTRTCPQCKTNIQKNGGCNHMTCKKCRHEFCWLCLTNWYNHNSMICETSAVAPIAQQAHAQQHEQITWQNMHTHFARDPRGFVDMMRNNYDLQIGITIEFAERFMRLSCEDQARWVTRINQLLQRDQWNYQYQMYASWNAELARFEPFALHINNYFRTQEGTFAADIAINRDGNVVTKKLADQIKDWIINQNPHDLILFNGWTCETSLTRERLQEVLDQASRHFRDHRE
ncbi:hypothetical protein BH09DEP1_BH09DEP1_3350 [soil metagenome]